MEIVEIDKELEELEVKIDQLRGLYEQYFMGLEKLEPQIPRKDVEKRIKILRKEQIRNTAQRFKFNMLAQRINTLSQHWGRVVREIENGTYKRDVLRAAARFGDGAFAGMGKKKAKQLAAAAAAAGIQAKRTFDDAMELGADDLIEDEEEDEAPTPPKFEQPPVSGRGLGQGDLPVVGGGGADPISSQRFAPAPASAQPVARASGLRWGSAPATSDPTSSVRPAAADVKRRVAELAAEMRTARPQDGGGPGFGELDLDFDEGAASRRAGDGAMGGRPLPAAMPPPARASVTGARPSPAATPPPAARAPQPQAGGFGVLDIPLDGPMPAPVPAPTASSPGSGVRTGMGSMSRPLAAPAAARPAPATATPVARPGPAAPAQGGDLGDQRIRQIYAKYVEAKRSTQESTAGVTYEKLAASLRAQAEKLKSAHPSKSIDYEVVVKDGKTHLKPVLK
jgi:hypothetical protein